jgi:hypothetical protein
MSSAIVRINCCMPRRTGRSFAKDAQILIVVVVDGSLRIIRPIFFGGEINALPGTIPRKQHIHGELFEQ